MDYSAANEWLCDGFERNSALFLPEDLHESMFILLYELIKSAKKKKKSISTQSSRQLSITDIKFAKVGIDWFTIETHKLL